MVKNYQKKITQELIELREVECNTIGNDEERQKHKITESYHNPTCKILNSIKKH